MLSRDHDASTWVGALDEVNEGCLFMSFSSDRDSTLVPMTAVCHRSSPLSFFDDDAGVGDARGVVV